MTAQIPPQVDLFPGSTWSSWLVEVDDLGWGLGEDIGGDPGLGKELDKGIVGVFAEADEPFDTGIDQHLGAENAGRMGAVEDRPFEAYPVERCLDDAVLLGVDGPADFMTGAGGDVVGVPQAAEFQTVFKTGSGTVVSGRQNVLVFDGYGSDVVSQAGGTFRHHRSDLKEVFV